MTAALRPSPSACPACAAAPAAEALAHVQAPVQTRIMLSLPTIHCAACMNKVERALSSLPDVKAARVNLTLKRVSIDAEPNVTAQDLIPVVESAGYEAHELDGSALAATATDRSGRDLLMRVAVAGFAAMNVMLLSVAVWSGAEGPTRDLFHWISAAIVLPAVAFCAMPFFRNAYTALSAGRLNMDVPISLAILLAVGTSLYETSLSGEHAYFDAAIALTFFLLTGRYLDHRTRSVARSAAEELAALEVPRAWLETPQGEAEVNVADLAVGDIIHIRPGGRIPVDGTITHGASELDRSLLTGETLPVQALIGQTVSAGEVNLTGPISVQASAVGRDSSLNRMADLVAIAESGRSQYTSLADRAAKLYAPGVHILSALAFVGWYIYAGDLRMSLNIAAAVLIITCPCALGLAVPAVTAAASGRLFRKGLLIKDATALERLAEVDTIVFDKTGTLTAGAPTLTNLSQIPPELCGVALALAQSSSHPLSQSIASTLIGEGQAPAQVDQIAEIPGHGTQGCWQGQTVRLGRADWVGGRAMATTCTWLAIDGTDPIVFTFSDALRDGTPDALAELQKAGYDIVIMSGDSAAAVEDMANRLSVTNWLAEALPADKADRIALMSAKGAKVLMVGDGLNDTAALASAHASISPASALDAARVASDIVLLGKSLAPLPEALRTAQLARRRIRQNFSLASWYNVIAVPLAIAGLCSPLIAALAMSASSITVSLNALRLR